MGNTQELCKSMNTEALIKRIKNFLSTYPDYDVIFSPNHESKFYHIQILKSGMVIDRVTNEDLNCTWFRAISILENRVSNH